MAKSNTVTDFFIKTWQGINKKIIFPILKRHRKKYAGVLQDVSFVTSNCIGGVLSHAYGLKFKSPTVNLFMTAKDFISFAENLNENLRLPLMPCESHSHRHYPIGKIGDSTLHFVHYPDFETAQTKWTERAARVDVSHVIFILCERDGCTEDEVARFAQLPYPKIFLAKNETEYDFAWIVLPTRYEKRHGMDPMDRLMIFSSFGKRRFEKYITPNLLLDLAQRGE